MIVYIVHHLIHSGNSELHVFKDEQSANQKVHDILTKSYKGLECTTLSYRRKRWAIVGRDAEIMIEALEVK